MTVTVRIPGPLRAFCEGKAQFVVEGAATVDAAIAALPAGVRERILDEQGRLRQHVNVFVGETSIRETGGLTTPLTDGASIFVIPAVSGGSCVGSALPGDSESESESGYSRSPRA